MNISKGKSPNLSFYIYVPDWRIDGKCGPQNPLPDGRPGQCDPNANANEKGPCCNPRGAGWCGNSDAHCKCSGCTDFRKTTTGNGEHMVDKLFKKIAIFAIFANLCHLDRPASGVCNCKSSDAGAYLFMPGTDTFVSGPTLC